MDVNRKELAAIKEVLKDSPHGMTVTEVSKSVKINRHSAAKYLEVLVATGHVDMKYFGPSKVYYLSQRVPVSAMLSFSSDLIITLDKDMRARNVNDRFLELMGLAREDVLNKNIGNFSYPFEMDPPIMPHIKAALKGGESSADTFYPKGDNGYYFIVKCLPTVFEDGENGVTLIMSDITERKRIENAIRESERKFRDMLEQSTDGISMCNEQGVLIEFSRGFRRLTGMAKKDAIGKYVWELPFFLKGYEQIPERHKKPLKDYTLEFLETGKSPLTDRYDLYDLVRPDGTVRTVLVNIFPIKTEKGHILCTIARDITDMRKAEMALKESEGKFRSIIEQSLDGIILIDEHSVIIEFNKGLEMITGHKKAQMIGKHAGSVFNLIRGLKSRRFPKSLEEFKKQIADCNSTYQSGDRKFYEFDIVRSDGVRRIVQALPFEIEIEKRIVCCIIVRDITEQKQAEICLKESEEKFRNLAETTTSGILIVQDSRITYANRAVEAITGYGVEELLHTDGMLEFIHPIYKEAMENIRSHDENSMRSPRSEFKIVKKDGDERWIEATRGSMSLNGRPAVIITFFDVTGRKMAEEALLKEHGALEVRVNERTIELEDANKTLKAEVEKRVFSENALQVKEEKFRYIVENVNDWIWETDTTGRFVYSSPRVHDILGYRPEEVIGIRPFDMMLPENGKKLYYRLMEITQKGLPFTGLEGEHLHRDGHTVFVDVSGKPIRDKQGAIIGYMGIAHDITDQKIAEKKLLQTTYELNAIFSAFPDIIFRIGRDGTILGYNTARTDRLHARPEGKNIRDVLPGDIGQKIGEAIESVSMTGKMAVIEYSVRMGDRDEAFEARLQPAPDEQVIIIVRPITEKKRMEEALRESENRFRSLVESVNDIAWEMDMQGQFTYVSPKLEDILGYPPEHYLGKVVTEFMPVDDVPSFSPGFARLLVDPQPFALASLRIVHRNGEIRSMEMNGTPFYDDKGQFCGFRGVARDITKRKRMEEMLGAMKSSMDIPRKQHSG